MAEVPMLADHANIPRVMINVESVGLSPEQFFRLCCDNPDLRLELTAQKELVVMSPANAKTGMLNAEIVRAQRILRKHCLAQWHQRSRLDHKSTPGSIGHAFYTIQSLHHESPQWVRDAHSEPGA